MMMKKFLAVALSVYTAACAQAAEIGKPAPEFALKDGDGAEVSLAAYKGKLVVVEWFNNGCPFVKKHYGSGAMQKLQESYTAKGVVWLLVCSSAPGKQGHIADAAAAARIKSEWNIGAAKLLLDPDGKVGKLYGAKTTPHMFVVGRQGELAYAGAIDDDTGPQYNPAAKNYVAAALDELLAGKPVSTPATQSYGCSVKYAK